MLQDPISRETRCLLLASYRIGAGCAALGEELPEALSTVGLVLAACEALARQGPVVCNCTLLQEVFSFLCSRRSCAVVQLYSWSSCAVVLEIFAHFVQLEQVKHSLCQGSLR